MQVKSFEDLEVWQKGRDLVVGIYMLTANLPQSETFGLTAQVKKAALSVPTNIAEGFGRYHYLDKAKFYLNARGSLYELKSHPKLAIESQKLHPKSLILKPIAVLGKAICSLLKSSGISNSFKLSPMSLP
jgi:four helix bundle protein